MKHILIQGATSAIAQAVCRALAKPGVHFCLLGRNRDRLQIVADDLKARGAEAEPGIVEPGSYASLEKEFAGYLQLKGHCDFFLSAQGELPDQEDCEKDPGLVSGLFQTNAVEVMQASLLVAKVFEKQGYGTCVIIGSVAGDRGRRGNYLYGSTKASLDTFCDGLRQRLEPSCRVLLVKPGPVDTPMTAHLKKTALFATPDKVASDILSALKKESALLYTPGFWRWVMLLIRWLPSSVVKRLRA